MDLDREQPGARFVVGTRPDAGRAGSFAGAAVYAALGTLYFAFVVACILTRGGMPIAPGWTAKVAGGAFTVVEVEPAGPATALKPGDRIVSAANDPYAGSFGPALALSRVPYGGRYVLHLLRDNVPHTVLLSMESAGKPTWNEYLPSLFIGFLYLAAAYFAALRWRDLTARLAATSFCFTSFSLLSITISQFPGWNWQTSALAIVLARLYRPWEIPLAYHFCSRFPKPIRETSAGHCVRWALYAGAALLWIPLNVPVLAHVMGAPPLPVFRALLPFGLDARPGALMIAAFESISGVLICLVLVRNYLRLRDPDSRRKIRWAGLAFGTAVGAFVIFAVLKVAWYLTGSVPILHLAVFVNDISAYVIGLSFIGLAYAVARHRVLGIRVVLRRGLQYLLARNVLRLVVFLPLLIVLFGAIVTDRGLKDVLLHSSWPFYFALAVTGAVSLRYRGQMRLWLDRKFFRSALAQEQMLAALIERLKSIESEEELCLVAGSELTKALHVNGCHVFLLDRDGRMRVAYSQLPDRAARLREWLTDHEREPVNPSSPYLLYEVHDTVTSEVDEYEPEPTEHLIVPVTGTDSQGIGTLVLGPKRSEQPYTSRDRDLLTAVAGQMAIMHEVLCLKQSVAQEQRVRVQVLGHLDHERVQLLNECPECGRCYTTADTACAHDGARLSMTLPVERTIDGKYRLERRIGRGGMGVVYRCRDIRLDREVAIKIMTGDLFGNSAAIARFEREARSVAVLKHPNIVAVHDFGRLPTGGAYLVMELIDGRSWRQYLKFGRGFSERASGWMTQLCLAVEAAHAGGIVHRDLKPENLMIANQGGSDRVIVLDFGLAKVIAELAPSDRDLTISGAVMGSRGYMSPEQRSGRTIDLRTDVYSVAVICAETLTGRRPPRGGASLEWLKASLKSTTPSQVQLSHVLQKALAENPGQRPSMRELREELEGAMLACISQSPAAADEAESTDTLTMPPEDVEDR